MEEIKFTEETEPTVSMAEEGEEKKEEGTEEVV